MSITNSIALLRAFPDRVARRARLSGVVAIVACACAIAPISPIVRDAHARAFETTSLAAMRVSQLPAEGRAVLAAIHAGGPFVSPRDSVVFGNRERMLPRRPRGYYAEYTVPTPGLRTRGARRIIAGRGDTGDFRNSGEYYYTDDHYQSFRRIAQ